MNMTDMNCSCCSRDSDSYMQDTPQPQPLIGALVRALCILP